MSTLERSRDRLMQQLLDAVTLLTRLQAGAAEGAIEQLADVERELSLRREAMDDVEALLAGDKRQETRDRRRETGGERREARDEEA